MRLFCLIPKNVCCFAHFLREFVSKSCYNHQEQVNKVNESLTKLHPDYSAIFLELLICRAMKSIKVRSCNGVVNCDVCCFSYSRQDSCRKRNTYFVRIGQTKCCSFVVELSCVLLVRGWGEGGVVVKTNVLFLRLAFGPSSPPPATISQLIHTTTDQH